MLQLTSEPNSSVSAGVAAAVTAGTPLLLCCSIELLSRLAS